MEMLGNLAIVIAVIVIYFGLMYWLKKANRSKGNVIELMATLSISQKEKIIMIKVENQRFLLGIASQNISLIGKLDDASSFSDGKLAETAFHEVYSKSAASMMNEEGAAQ
jgi:flagellar biogenesis protein FliO